MKTDRNIPKPPKRSGRGKWKLPKHCASCEAADTVHPKEVASVQIIRGEEIECMVPKYVCSECQSVSMSPAQGTEGVKIAVATYQSKHGLLTAEEIKKIRADLAISSAEKFAAQIKVVSSATLKRIEAGVHVQDKSTDSAIRQAVAEMESTKNENWVPVSLRQTKVHVQRAYKVSAKKVSTQYRYNQSQNGTKNISPYTDDNELLTAC